jgi:beta-lactam-binding protein with PASTA domain/tRNA A-37 threonylcarbamoyl transferase component Bud32
VNAPTEKIFNNRYRVDGLLGNGGMALVYCGTDTLLRRRVAIKVLREQFASDDDFIKRFSYEAQSAAKLSHPNIVSVYDFGTEDHSYYIVMELVDGSTLGDLMRDERVLPEPVAVDYAVQIASGLAYAHRQGLLHRDVKPANILVTKDDVVKISDFGIARTVSEHTLAVTQPGMVMGSVAYISPEQAQNHAIDERSDLYSLGVVLYQMLTGSLPFSGDTPVAVALKHVSEDAPAIDPATTGVSPAVASIVGRLLRKNPQERFSSATELASALREARERPHLAHGTDDAPASKVPMVPPPRRSSAPDLAAANRAVSNRASAYVTSVDDPGDLVEQHTSTRVDPRWYLMPALLLLAVAIGFFALRGTAFAPAAAIALPDLHGKSATVAQQQLLGLGLRANVTNEDSDSVPQDHVIRQDPPAGTNVPKNAVIALVVSGGLPRVQVPDVKGFTADDAQRRLQEAKLKSKVFGKYDNAVPSGQVIDVNPAVDTSVRQGATVVLTVSKGKQPITVPNVVSLTLDDARRRLAAAGLTLRVGQKTESDTIPENVIASQDPSPGQAADAQATVNVVVSTGPQSVSVPSVVGSDLETAQSQLRNAGLEPVIAYNVDPTNASGKVGLQLPAGGTKTKKNAKVKIFLSVPGTVPDVSGMSVDEAKRALVQSGYQVGNTVNTSEGTVQDGQVVKTEPEANAQLTPGESVNIHVMKSGTPP